MGTYKVKLKENRESKNYYLKRKNWNYRGQGLKPHLQLPTCTTFASGRSDFKPLFISGATRDKSLHVQKYWFKVKVNRINWAKLYHHLAKDTSHRNSNTKWKANGMHNSWTDNIKWDTNFPK